MGIRNLHTRTIKYRFSTNPIGQFGVLFFFLCWSICLNGQATCSNITNGGEIMGTEMGCANPLFDPGLISSVALPTGGSGTIEYLWMKTTGDPSAPFNTWDIIPGAKEASYDPLPIEQTTYYARCSRRSGCSDYDGETTFITKEVRCCNFNGSIVANVTSACTGIPITLSVASAATGLSYQWESTSGSFDNATSPTPIYMSNTTGTTAISVRLSNGTCSEVISTSLQIQSNTAVVITPSTSTVCEGGNITLTTNGTATSQYTWTSTGGTFDNATSASPVFSATTAGVYTVTVEITNTSGCNGTASIPITVGSLTASPTITNASCNGGDGSISIAVTGGVAPYTYDWGDRFGNTPTIENLEAGIYIVIITDREGCSTTTSAEVNNSADLTATLLIQQTSCAGTNDGAIDLSISGGQAPYIINWDNNIGAVEDPSGLRAGVYNVVIQDQSGCVLNEVAIVGEASALNIAFETTATSCGGASDGTIVLTASQGIAPYSYTWTGGISTGPTANNLVAGNYQITVVDATGCSNIANVTVVEPDPINITVSTQSSCAANSGLASAVVTGGNAPYTYRWNDAAQQITANASNLMAGTYTLTVTDNSGCIATATAPIEIDRNSNLNLSIVTESACTANSGVAEVVVAGGNSSFTYLWNDPAGQTSARATNLTAGTYTVTVTNDMGCTATATTPIEIDRNSDLNLSIVTESACAANSGIAEVFVNGGNSSYTYSWNDSNNQTSARATNLTAGTYTVTVSNDMGCTATATTTIAITGNSDLNLITRTESSCAANSGIAEVMVAGGNSSYTYLWNDPTRQTTARAINLAAAGYTVTVTNALGCTATATAIITIASGDIAVNITAANTCSAGTGTLNATVTGGSSNYTYAWSDGQTTAQAINLTAGNYTLTVTDNLGCTGVATGTVTQLSPLAVSIAPTPTACNGGATGTINLTVGNGIAPYTYTWNNNLPNQASLTGLPEGDYQVTVTDANGCTGIAKTTILSDAGFDITVNTENATCLENNGRAVVTINGPLADYTYRWNDSANQTASAATGLAPAIYTVTVTASNGCTIAKNAPISRTSTNLSLSIFPTNATVCSGTPVAFSSTVVGEPVSYSWASDSGTFDPPNSPNPNYIGTENGRHSITLTIKDVTNCEASASAIVTIIDPVGGQISTTDNTTICIDDDISSVINTSVSGNVGSASSWLVTDISGNIIAVQTSPSFNLERTGIGICFIQHIAYSKTLTTGLIPGNNIATINGCYALSNSIRVEKLAGSNCPLICDVVPTTIQSNGASNICADDGIADVITLSSTGTSEQTAWLIMDASNTILSLPASATFDLEGMSGGTISVVEINYKGDITGLAVGNNVAQITGCFAVSNTISINLQVGPECPNFCGVMGGTLSTSNVTNLCVADGIEDLIDVAILGNTGAFSTWVVTDIHERILALPPTMPFNFEGIGEGTCFIWHISSRDPLNNIAVGVSLSELTGCFALSSNAIEINRTVPQAINILPSAALSCRNIPIQFATDLTGPTLSFEWTSEAGVFDNANSASPTLTINESGIYIVSVTVRNGICASTASTTIQIQNDIELAFDATNTQCAGDTNGSIVLSAIGGTAPYTYTWANGLGTTASLSGLAEGIYSVTVVDALGCSASTNIEIGLASNLSVRLATQNLVCNQDASGGIVATAVGGVEPYAFTWNGQPQATNALSGLSAGNYVVEVTDALNCRARIETDLTEPAALSILLTAEAATCNQGGSVAVQTSGGTGTYSYQWTAATGTNSPTLDNLEEGTYGVTVSDQNNCSISDVISVGKVGITQCDIVVTSPIMNLNGNEGQLEMQVSGGSQYIYAWNTGATGASIDQLPSGNYSATVTDEFGCSCSDVVGLENPAKIGDFVFEDKNDNGLQDIGEVGLRGVHIELTGTTTSGNLVVQDTRTDKNGMYMFIVPSGQYKITVLDYLNLKVSTPNAGDDELDSDLDPISFMSETIFLFGGEFYDHLDIGLVPKGFCDNVLGGGIIAEDEEICAPNGNPELIYNVTYPTGGSGEVEYLWLMSHKPEYTPDDPDWLEIPNTNEEFYDPDFIARPTYYVRCARRKGCDNYPGETPVVAKTLVNCAEETPIAEALRVAVMDNEIQLAWDGMIPMEHSNFVIERSEDGLDFSVISSTKAFFSTSYTKYDFMDKTPLIGENYYRIKTVHPDFMPTYSNVAMAMLTPKKDMRVMIYPNPVLQDVTIHFLEELEEETALLDISNGFGQIIRQVKIDLPTKKYILNMGDLPGGIYYLKFQNRSLKRYSQKILKKE